MTTPRLMVALVFGLSLACMGAAERVEDEVKDVVATQAARAIAQNLGVPAEQVTVAPLDSGRWALATPDWSGECGFGPQARKPHGSVFKIDASLMGDCLVTTSCTKVFGVPCAEGDDAKVGLTFHIHPDTPLEDVRRRRTDELSKRRMMVSSRTLDANPDARVLTAIQGKAVRAVAVVAEGEGGATVELLVSRLIVPVRRAKAP